MATHLRKPLRARGRGTGCHGSADGRLQSASFPSALWAHGRKALLRSSGASRHEQSEWHVLPAACSSSVRGFLHLLNGCGEDTSCGVSFVQSFWSGAEVLRWGRQLLSGSSQFSVCEYGCVALSNRGECQSPLCLARGKTPQDLRMV